MIRVMNNMIIINCTNHLVSFIKVDGLFVSYIVDIFDIIKSRMMVYRSMHC